MTAVSHEQSYDVVSKSKGITVISVRPIASTDWPVYREVRLQALKDSPQAFGGTWQQEALLPEQDWSTRAIASESGQSGRGFFAINKDEVCGLAWCQISDSNPHVANIYALWTAPSVRGQGAGRALLEKCIAWANNKGVRHIRLSVTQDESPAMQLYKSKGFCTVGEPEFLRPGSDVMTQKMELRLAVDV